MAWTQTGQLKTPVAAADITDATTVGKAVLTAANAAAARTAIGAATAAQGALADSAVQPGDLAAVATTGDAADLGGELAVAQAPASSGVFDYCVSGTWGGRPTTRTDITCTYVKASASDPDPSDFVAGRDLMYEPQA